MISSARTLLIGGLLLAPVAAWGETAVGASATSVADARAVIPDSSVIVATRDLVAAQWGVAPDRLQLDWGRVPSLVAARAGEVRQLVGRGTDGWFAVVVQPANSRPVSVRVRAGVEDSVWVAARAIQAGEVLAADDLRGELEAAWGPPGEAFARPAVGWEVRRPLAPGDQITTSRVTPPAVIAAGETVRFEWDRGGVHLVLTGTAMNSAREGDAVRARIPGRDEPVSGVAVAPGLAMLVEGGSR